MRNSETTANNIFLFLFFYLEKFIFCMKRYFEKRNLYCYICITAFFAWQFIVCIGLRRRTLIQKT